MTVKVPPNCLFSSEQYSLLTEAITEASDLLMAMWPHAPGDGVRLDVQSKSDGSLVSKADFGSNEILCRSLKKLFPEDQILSEEGVQGESTDAVKSADNGSRVWIIDPLDGTKSFLAGRDDFSILVALSIAGAPVFGVMRFPARAIQLVAQVGEGCTVNGSAVTASSSRCCGANRVYFRNFESNRPELACDYMDSGLAFMKVAAGELDGAVIRMTHHKEWDIAAPIAAIVGAGGTVSDESGGSVLLGADRALPNYIVVSGGACHAELLDCIPLTS